ncbi:hypothetical protein PQQ75_25040 [Paraburkholderia aspalathi]|uniref:hypothetical protein n=1 Tax=Paraburkholderia aspalathi TaxID=1324617 RepID=UPI0038B837C0
MLKRVGELLREHDATKAGKPSANSPFRLASYFANEAPDGATPHYSQVAEEFSHFPDVFPLYFGPTDSPSVEQPARLTRERISEIWEGMPGGFAGFCKQWGYQQFAQAVEDEVRATFLAPPQQPAGDERGLTPESLAEEMFDAAIRYSNGHVTDFRERAEDILARNGKPA